MESQSWVTKDDFWRLQETLTDITAMQNQQSDRLSRLEKRLDDGTRSRSLWAPSSPFPNTLGAGSAHESTLNPAAEAFRNFDSDAGTGLISSLSLDNTDDARRAVASRANSVRFDESANNHYGQSRQSIDLPARTGSGLGGHPLSERSLSHRSDGKGSTGGFTRANSFGLESSRLLGSIHNSPRVSGNPPPGFFSLGQTALGPYPAIIRCWLSETFSNDSLLYAAVCSGSATSSVSLSLLQQLGLTNEIMEEGGIRKIKLPVYLTEAKISYPSSRSTSPAPQVPTLISKFVVSDQVADDKTIQIILGGDLLRSHCADILFSQDKLLIFDEDRNQLSIPLIRPENDQVYKNLRTGRLTRLSSDSATVQSRPTSGNNDQPIPGIIGQPGRKSSQQVDTSPTLPSPSIDPSTVTLELGSSRRSDIEPTSRSSTEFGSSRHIDDSKASAENESFPTPLNTSVSGVWANSWRSAASAPSDAQNIPKPTSSYSKPITARPMKVLRPSKSSAGSSRTVSSTNPSTNGNENIPPTPVENERKSSLVDVKSNGATQPKSNPIGSGSAFGWLNPAQRRTTTTG